jgi:shikimate dehydrogenase
VATPLVKRARAAGAEVVDGLPMLLQQAASSFRIWTGRDAPVDIMRAALFASVT